MQLEEFSREFGGQFKLDEKNAFRTWFDAFELLEREILKSRIRKKKVIVLDEFPWMATKNSSFLAAFIPSATANFFPCLYLSCSGMVTTFI